MKLKLVGFFLSCFLWIIHGMLAPPGELHELLHCELHLWFSNRDSGPTRDLGTTSACWTEINKRFFKRGRLHDQQHTDYSRGRPSAAAGEDRGPSAAGGGQSVARTGQYCSTFYFFDFTETVFSTPPCSDWNVNWNVSSGAIIRSTFEYVQYLMTPADLMTLTLANVSMPTS